MFLQLYSNKFHKVTLLDSPLGLLQGLTISDSDRALLNKFQENLRDCVMETCSVCKERWFGINISPDGVF